MSGEHFSENSLITHPCFTKTEFSVRTQMILRENKWKRACKLYIWVVMPSVSNSRIWGKLFAEYFGKLAPAHSGNTVLYSCCACNETLWSFCRHQLNGSTSGKGKDGKCLGQRPNDTQPLSTIALANEFIQRHGGTKGNFCKSIFYMLAKIELKYSPQSLDFNNLVTLR